MTKYLIFLEVKSKHVVIIGGGTIAVQKAKAFLATEARLVVVADTANNVLASFCRDTTVAV